MGLAAVSARGASVSIEHSTAGALGTELTQALTENGLDAMTDITELTITGSAEMNGDDFKAIRANLRPSLERLDLGGANLANNHFPGDPYAKEGALNKMGQLVSVVLPENLTSIYGGVFYQCTKLRDINIPDGVTQIFHYAFQECSKLELGALPEHLKNIHPYSFYKCTSLALTELPTTVTLIGGDAFNETGVRFATLPEGLLTLGERAFRNSKVTFGTFPSTLQTVGQAVLCNVHTVTDFTIPDVAGLWTKLPNQCFFLIPASGETRTFTCLSPTPPAATVDTSGWNGTFGQTATFPTITVKVLGSAMPLYQATAPYSTMNLVAIPDSTSAVKSVGVDTLGPKQEGPVEYYDLQGRRVAEPVSGQMYLRRQGTVVAKVIAD